MKGALKVRKFSTDDFLVIAGSEIKTNSGEIIGLFLNEEIKSHNFIDVVNEIKDQDGIIVLPHAYKNKDPEKLVKKVDAIECLNARTAPGLNLKANILSDKYGLPKISGSDAHLSFEIGRVVTCFPYESLDNEEIKKFVIKGNRRIIGHESPYVLRMLSIILGKYRRKLNKEF